MRSLSLHPPLFRFSGRAGPHNPGGLRDPRRNGVRNVLQLRVVLGMAGEFRTCFGGAEAFAEGRPRTTAVADTEALLWRRDMQGYGGLWLVENTRLAQ